MTDFLQRVSHAALGRTPAIQPLVRSQYAPKTLMPGYEMASSDVDEETRRSEAATASESAGHLFVAPTSADQSVLNVVVADEPESHAAGTPSGGRRYGRTLSRKETPGLPSVASSQTSEDHVSTEGPASHSMSAAATSEVKGIKDPSRELAGPTSRQSIVDISDEKAVEANSQPRVQVNVERERSFPRRDPSVDSASARREDEELLEVQNGKIAVPKSESHTRTEPVVNGERLVEAIEPGRQRTPGEQVGPSMVRGLVDQPRSRRVKPRSAGLPSSLDDRNDTAPANVIRVTIGRIDVRAVTPPLPPVKSSVRPAPKLSLDEFLRQHNGRSR